MKMAGEPCGVSTKKSIAPDTLCEMEAVFPEAVKYDRSGGRFDPRFVLAMIAFKGHPFPWGRLFGAELLLDLFRDPKSAIETRSLYGFDYRDFIAETGKCDVFSLEQVGNLSATVARREAQIAAHDQAVEERNVRIKVLQEEVAKLGAWGQAQEKILRERDKQIAHFNQTVASLKLVIAEREGRAEALQKEVDELIHLKQTQREEILERDARIASLTHAAAELEGKLSEVNKVLAERDANVASLTHATAELDGKIAGLNKVLAQRDAKVASLTVATVELDRVLAEREAKIAALVLSVAERSQELGAAQTELNSIYASRKWKLIMKVAVPVFFLKAVYGKMRALIRSTCNTFHRLAGHVPPTGLPVVRQPANDKAACDLRHPGTRGSE